VKNLPWATILTATLVVIAALVGGIVCVVNSDALSFKEYLNALRDFALATGLLAIGRGILGAGKAAGEAIAKRK
jgi:hypothetical protein